MSTSPVYKFQAQIKKAKSYEKIICDWYNYTYVGDAERTHDAVKQDKDTIEFKIDFHPNNYKNFFFERWSNDTKEFNQNNYGGPWRALRDEITELWYVIIQNKEIRRINIFLPNMLVDGLEEIVGQFELKKVRNQTYNTLGYCIPQSIIKHISTEYSYKCV